MEHKHRAMLVEMPIAVHAYDIDAMGIVSNIVYIRWFEDLRTRMLERYFPYREMMAEDLSPILAKTEAEYKFPVRIDDILTGRVWIEQMGRAKWTAAFEIVSEGKVHCLGKQSGYFYDVKRNRPIPIPQRIRSAYEESQSLT